MVLAFNDLGCGQVSERQRPAWIFVDERVNRTIAAFRRRNAGAPSELFTEKITD